MEHYEVLVHETAKADIRDAVGYIAKTLREPNTARVMAERLRDAIVSLSSMPERFPLVKDHYLSALGIRVTSAGNYLIFYVVNQEEHRVDILRVLYGKRNWISILTENGDIRD